MTTVTGKLIGWTAGQRTEMKATLVDATGKPAVGYVASVPGELVRPVTVTPDADGDWTVELTPNASIQSDVGDTLWAIQEGRAKDGNPLNTYVVVPDTGGPYWAGEIRANLSGTITGGSTVVYLPGAGATPLGAAGAGDDIALRSTDPTTTNARTPTTHHASHATGGSDPIAPTDIGAETAGTASAAVSAHAGAVDPHGDRAYTDTQTATRVPTTRQITAGTGLTGGGTLDTDRALAVAYGTATGTAAAGDDSRLSDARTPTGSAGGDLSGTYPAPTVAKVNGVAVTGTPTAGQVPTAISGTTASWQTPTAPPSPASTVTPETSYGQASQAGTGSAYARGDHTHGTPTLPAPADIGAETSGAAASAVGTHAGAADPHGDRAYADGKLAKTANLSDLASASTARSNLGLGGAALLAVGTSTGTVAAGDDSRITGALPATGGTISGSLAVTGNALGEDKPAAHGIAAWCYDPALAVNSTQLTAGTLYLVRVNIATNVNATKIYWWVANTGSSAVAGQNLVGLYDSSGTLLTSTNVDASFSSATLKTTTITSQTLTAGSFYWVALLFNASVTPTLTRASGWTGVDTAANLGMTAATYRFAKNGTGRTALPSSITPTSNVGTDFAGPWVAVG